MTLASNKTGNRGERIAQSYLIRKGFQPQAMNWRLGRIGELDLIMYHPVQQLLAFIEVKARKTLDFGVPVEAITRNKVWRISRLAEVYLGQHPPASDTNVRFDVIAIQFAGKGKPAVVEHLEGAFEPVL